jgi:hypothetical protein
LTAWAVRALLALAIVVGPVGAAPAARGAADPPGTPFGNVETAVGAAGAIEVGGWALDPSTTSPIYVWVTVDGAGRHLHANRSRPDVGAAFPAYGPAHGFAGSIVATAGRHTVCVTASNVGPGAHKALGCRTVTVLPAASPVGNLEAVRAGSGTVGVSGWAIDPNTTGPVYVWVSVDGAGRHLYADLPRPDVAAAHPRYGPGHGFSGTLAAAPGTRTVCATAVNVGPGAHTSLGCRTVTVPSPEVLEAQKILAKFAIPTGQADGVWGPQTAQGLCTFRLIAGLPVSRDPLTAADLAKLRGFNAAYASLGRIPAAAKAGRSTYFVATQTCQTMLYVKDGHHERVLRISTGKPGFETPVGAWVLGATQPGWSCSTLYPEACFRHTAGMNARYPEEGVPFSQFGNMYNKRVITGSYLLHGSLSVPTYPASHGCVRVSIEDSDWLYTNVTNAGRALYVEITGSY